MLAGGAEELHATEAAVFDTLFATSVSTTTSPTLTPRPFDGDRDGLVLGEGACTLRAGGAASTRRRAARRILAEIVGFGTNSDGMPRDRSPTPRRWRGDAAGAGRAPASTAAPIGYVNAHGTATDHGDVAESQRHEPGVRAARSRHQLAEELHGPHAGRVRRARGVDDHRDDARGLVRPDAQPDRGRPALRASWTTSPATAARSQTDHVMSNNFAFGGINTSLIFKRRPHSA